MTWLLPQKGKPLCTLLADKDRDVDSVVYIEGTETSLTIESLIILHVLSYETVLDKIRLSLVSHGPSQKSFPNPFGSKIIVSDCPPTQITNVTLPAVFVEDEKRVVAGLCSTIRYILLQHGRHEILGFRAACLASCAQTSSWTNFCEREIPATARKLLEGSADQTENIPECLLVLEHEFGQPVRTHNDKHWKRVQKVEELSHNFVEGCVITLSDLIVFLPLHLILKSLQRKLSLHNAIPKVIEWHNRMLQLHGKNPMMSTFLNLTLPSDNYTKTDVCDQKIEIKELPLPTTRFFAHGQSKEPVSVKNRDATIISKILKSRNFSLFDCNLHYGENIDWEQLPEYVRPESGSLPPDRVNRKREQISNVINAVLSIARHETMTIVDFCSGGGHVGIALAYLLPKCRLYLIENKDGSMYRARKRVQLLSLQNVWFYQCNLDQFLGDFDLGVALHACGGATDLVMQKCIESRASLVCVPCCYGSIKNKEPNASKLRQVLAENADQSYAELCHFADRHQTTDGIICMESVDTDRAQRFEEAGYTIKLTKLTPRTCTPKNNIIVCKAPS